MASTTIYATNVGHFRLGGNVGTYASIHDGSVDLQLLDQNDAGTGGQDYTPNDIYIIWRSSLQFPLTVVGDNIVITAATLSLRGTVGGDFSTTDFNMTAVSGSAIAGTVVAGDVLDLLAATASSGTINTSSWVTNDWNVITLNATGRTAIKDALVKDVVRFGIRSNNDISSTAPNINGDPEYVSYYGMGATTTYRPYLTLTYTAGETAGALAVVGETLHYVSITGVEYVIQGTAV